MEKRKGIEKGKRLISSVLIATTLFTSCWWWGGWWGWGVEGSSVGISVTNSDFRGNQQNIEDEDSKIVYWKIIDDPLEGSEVRIKTVDGYTLYETRTDGRWVFWVDVEELRKKLDEFYGKDVDVNKVKLVIEAEGWVEIYTRDKFKGRMMTIKLEGEGLEDIVVNPLSTKLVEEVKIQWYRLTELNRQIVEQVIKNLQTKYGYMYDVDGDWKITIKDFNRYDPDEYDSGLEDSLRDEGYFKKLKKWEENIDTTEDNFEKIREVVEKFINTNEDIDDSKIKEIKSKEELIKELEAKLKKIEEEIERLNKEIQELKDKLNNDSGSKEILEAIEQLDAKREELLAEMWEIKYLLNKETLTEEEIKEAIWLINWNRVKRITRGVSYGVYRLVKGEENLENKKEELAKQLNNLEKIKEVLEGEIENIKENIEKLGKEIQDKEIQDKEIQIKEIEKGVEQINSQIKDLEEELKRYEEDRAKAKEYLDRRNRLLAQIEDVKENMDYWFEEDGKYSEEYFDKRRELGILDSIPGWYEYKFFEKRWEYKGYNILVEWYRQNRDTQTPFILVLYINWERRDSETLYVENISEVSNKVSWYNDYIKVMIDWDIAYEKYKDYKVRYDKLINQKEELKEEILRFVKKYEKEDWTYYSIPELINRTKEEISNRRKEKDDKLSLIRRIKEDKERLKSKMEQLKEELEQKRRELLEIQEKINKIKEKLTQYQVIVKEEMTNIEDYLAFSANSNLEEITNQIKDKEEQKKEYQKQEESIKNQIEKNRLTNELRQDDPLYYDENKREYIYDINQIPSNPTRLIGWLRYWSEWYMRTPYTIYIKYGINGDGSNYPAKVWVEYVDGEGVKIYKEEIVNNYEYKEYIKWKLKEEIENKLRSQFVEEGQLNVGWEKVRYWIRKDDSWKCWGWYEWRDILYRIKWFLDKKGLIKQIETEVLNMQKELKEETTEINIYDYFRWWWMWFKDELGIYNLDIPMWYCKVEWKYENIREEYMKGMEQVVNDDEIKKEMKDIIIEMWNKIWKWYKDGLKDSIKDTFDVLWTIEGLAEIAEWTWNWMVECVGISIDLAGSTVFSGIEKLCWWIGNSWCEEKARTYRETFEWNLQVKDEEIKRVIDEVKWFLTELDIDIKDEEIWYVWGYTTWVLVWWALVWSITKQPSVVRAVMMRVLWRNKVIVKIIKRAIRKKDYGWIKKNKLRLEQLLWVEDSGRLWEVGMEIFKKMEKNEILDYIKQLKEIKSWEDLINVARRVEYRLDPRIEWWAIKVKWDYGWAWNIIGKLEKSGWRYLEKESDNFRWVIVYESPNGRWKVNLREVSNSEEKFERAGYKVEATIDVIEIKWSDKYKTEIKFIMLKE